MPAHRPRKCLGILGFKAQQLRYAIALIDGVIRARPQMGYNGVLTNLSLPKLSSTGGYFHVRAGQTPRPDLNTPWRDFLRVREIARHPHCYSC